MAKFHLLNDVANGVQGLYYFHCPGCGNAHPVHTITPNAGGSVWGFNGDIDKPTISPSLLCNKDWPDSRCHSFIKDGKIQFLSDCWHSLKNQTVEIPEWESL